METSEAVEAAARSPDALVEPVMLVEPAPAAPVVPVALVDCWADVSEAMLVLVEDDGCVDVDVVSELLLRVVSVLAVLEGEVLEVLPVAATEPLVAPLALRLPEDDVVSVELWALAPVVGCD